MLLQELLGVLERPKFAQRLRDIQVNAAELTAGYARLTSGDSDLLRLRSYKQILILSPTIFVRDVLDRCNAPS